MGDAFDSMIDVRENILQIWTALGSTRRAGEYRQANHEQRMGLTASRAIQVGDTINDQNTGNAYPCMGISVSDWDVVKGFSVIKHIAEGQPISWTDVRPVSKNRPSWVGDVKPKPHFENKVVEHEFVVKILDQFDSDYD